MPAKSYAANSANSNAVLGRNKQNRTPSQQESVASHLFTILITISLLVVYGRGSGGWGEREEATEEENSYPRDRW